MGKMLKSDFLKIFVSFGFVASVFLGFLLCFTEKIYTDLSTMHSYSVFESLFILDKKIINNNSDFYFLSIYKSAFTGYSSMFLPLLSSFPFIFFMVAERDSGYIRYAIYRTKRIYYYLSKYICAGLSGGLCIMLGVVLFGLFSFCVFPKAEQYPNLMANVSTSYVTVEIIKKIISSFIYGFTNTALAFFLSSFCLNCYILLCVPFMVRYIWETAINKILTDQTDYEMYKFVFPFECYAPSQIPYIKDVKMLCSTVAITVIFNIVSLVCYIVIMEKRVDKGE